MRTSVHIAKHRIGADVAKEWTDIATDVESRGPISVPTSVPAGEMLDPMYSTCRTRHRFWHDQCRTPTFHPDLADIGPDIGTHMTMMDPM